MPAFFAEKSKKKVMFVTDEANIEVKDVGKSYGKKSIVKSDKV